MNPRFVPRLYSSPQQLAKGNTIQLGGIFTLPTSLLVLVHTTLPLPKKPQSSANKSVFTTADDMDGDTDSLGPVRKKLKLKKKTNAILLFQIPDWIKAEVADSQASWEGFTSSTNPAFEY